MSALLCLLLHRLSRDPTTTLRPYVSELESYNGQSLLSSIMLLLGCVMEFVGGFGHTTLTDAGQPPRAIHTDAAVPLYLLGLMCHSVLSVPIQRLMWECSARALTLIDDRTVCLCVCVSVCLSSAYGYARGYPV